MGIKLRKYIPYIFKGKAILLNAPVASGKDYAAARLMHSLKAQHGEFKQTIFDIAKAITGLSDEEFFGIYNDRESKEVPQVKFLGLSPRGLMIWISEEVCKPKFGNQYFGKPAAARIDTKTGCVFSDSGFSDEVYPIAEKLGAENLFIVRFNRLGSQFEQNDSRKFLRQQDCPSGVNFLDLKNDGDINEFCNEITNWATPMKCLRFVPNSTFDCFPY